MTTTSSMLPSYNHHSTHQSPFSSAFKSSVHRTSVLTRSSNAQDPSSNGSLLVKDKPSFPGKPEADVIVIGSGIGGLCCAGLLARYQQDVIVLESHDLPGGAAHSFDIKGYKFDSGPSLFSGLQSRGPQANPLAQVLDALGESLPCVNYDSWMVYVPEGEFLSHIGPTQFFKVGLFYSCYEIAVILYAILSSGFF
uniref:Uncharacterized protein MANES_07G025600 n=1 Tax=Rhizophora mucronata TaxID=61149 RepID=A0A2P2MQW8_RHIMU